MTEFNKAVGLASLRELSAVATGVRINALFPVA